MTRLQLEYLAQREKERANRAMEAENRRHNEEMEAQGRLSLTTTAEHYQSADRTNALAQIETQRANLANENILSGKLAEEIRSHTASENLTRERNLQTLQIENAKLAESSRQFNAQLSLKGQELEAQIQKNQYDYKLNKYGIESRERIASDQLTEQIRHNVHIEDNMKTLAEQSAQRLYIDSRIQAGRLMLDAAYRPAEVVAGLRPLANSTSLVTTMNNK